MIRYKIYFHCIYNILISFYKIKKVCSTAAPTSCEEGCPLIKDASDGCLKCSCDGGMWY